MRVTNVIVKDIFFNLKGGGKAADANTAVDEAIKDYPECRMFGAILPAYAFYLRHADNITFHNVQLRTHTDIEERHAIVADDVNFFRVTNSIIEPPKSSLAVFSFTGCKKIVLDKNYVTGSSYSFVNTKGMNKADLKMEGNYFEKTK